MRYMEQVRVDTGEVLVSVEMADLGVLMRVLNEVALREREEGSGGAAYRLWELSDRIADVEEQAQLDLVSGWNLS